MSGARAIPLGVVQVRSLPGQVEANLEHATPHVERAAAQGAEVRGLTHLACSAPALSAATRVIGLGAEDRGDDAAGLLVARLVRAAAPLVTEVHECSGDAGTLLGLLEGAGSVVLVDAARGGRPGAVERVPLGVALPPPTASTHGLGLAEALGVAAALGCLNPPVRLYVVHGRHFDPGPVTPEVAAGARAAAELILRDELGLR